MAAPHIDGYTIDRLLGRGGFASVYLATDDATGGLVAIKVLFEHVASEDDITRFDRERRSMAALGSHAHIVDVLDGGETADGHHFLVLEYVAAGSIRERLDRSGALPWPEVIDIGAQIADALDAAHRMGVLHRDIKPANILYDGTTAKLGDFGIARLVGQSNVTAAESIVGTLAYTPPEILHNQRFDGRGDIYQLGITLYEMLLGRAPFKSGSADNKAMVIRRILEDPAPALAQFDIPQPLSDLLDEVLAKDPADRPQTASEFRRRLIDVGGALGHASPELAEPPARERTTRTIPVERSPGERSDRTLVESGRGTSTQVLPRPDDTPVLQRPPTTPEPRRRRRRRLIPVSALLIAGAVGLAAVVMNSAPEAGPDDDLPLPIEPTLVRIEQPAFSAPTGSHGVIFASVANTAGLTAVGGAGDGAGADEQRGVIWTMAPDGTWMHRSAFAAGPGPSADAQRLRGIGVIDGVRLLAVGEALPNDDLDGVAWMGITVGRMVPHQDPSFTGPGRQSLRSTVGDPGRNEFLVVGERRGDDGPVLGLWVVTPGESWDDPQWTAVPVGSGAPGTMTDVAIAGDLATAVGFERVDDRDRAIVLIRRDDVWLPLIRPIPDTRLDAVDFFADRIVAVGTRIRGGVSEPVAVVTDTEGNGFVHRLPVDDVSGRAHDVVATAAGVFAVGLTGEVAGDGAIELAQTDGALWAFLPGDTPADDLWTTRDTDALRADGFQEFWSVAEYEGAVFALGRADEGPSARQVAAGWTVTVQLPASADTVDDDVAAAQEDVGADDPGCPRRAEVDAGVDLAVVQASATLDFALWICADDAGGLWYHGVDRGDASRWITLPAEEVAGGYQAVNSGGTVYRIVDGRLTVRAPSGTVRTDQPLIDE